MLAEVRRHLEGTVRALADAVEDVDVGWVARTRSLPDVWVLNQLRVTRPARAAVVIDRAEEHQADLPYRHVVVDDGDTARQLQEALAHPPWRVEREVLMTLEGPPDREVPTAAVQALQEDEMLSLMRRWLLEEWPSLTEAQLGQLRQYTRREGRLWRERSFGMRQPDGSPVALTKLRSNGVVAWVEDVYTVPSQRGRGYARALVTHATSLARKEGHEISFIVADDEDWPKDLYAKLGFRAAARTWSFHRAP
jgi:GNAT superfamily N-acetyltransferase